MRTYSTVTNIEYYQAILDDSLEGETNWTINRHARPGDRVLLYVCAPVSAFVAVAEVSAAPVIEEDPGSEFCGKYFAEMHGLRMLETPLKRSDLLAALPDFKYLKQPRQSIEIAPRFIDTLEGFLKFPQ
jgi:EVE domain